MEKKEIDMNTYWARQRKIRETKKKAIEFLRANPDSAYSEDYLKDKFGDDWSDIEGLCSERGAATFLIGGTLYYTDDVTHTNRYLKLIRDIPLPN